MTVRTRLALVAAATLTVIGTARPAHAQATRPVSAEPSAAPAAETAGSARDNSPAATVAPGTGLTPPPAPAAARGGSDLPARRPLMSLLDQANLAKPLDDSRIQIYGWVEGSYTYNFADPPRDLADYQIPVGKFIDNPGRVFDVEHDKVLMNQLALVTERTVSPAEAARLNQVDVGGRLELLYGADARFIHANGMFDNHEDDNTTRVTGGPQNQFDIPQVYADVAIPVGNGLRIRAGKFTFFKQFDPNASVFYSHSYTFGGALPFTLTGAYATYVLDERLVVDGGFSRGWDQALDDNNDALDVFGRARYAVNDDLQLSLAAITGPEQDGDNGNYRTAADFTVTYQAADQLTFLADVVWGQQAQPTGGGGNAAWYGVSLYSIYQVTDTLAAAARVEWYADDSGYTTGLAQNLYEATVGLTITPLPNDRYLRHLKIRPEVRIDYSDERFFDGFSKHAQVTAAVDAIFNF